MFDCMKREIVSTIVHCSNQDTHVAKSFYIYAFMFMSICTMHRLHFLVNSFFVVLIDK